MHSTYTHHSEAAAKTPELLFPTDYEKNYDYDPQKQSDFLNLPWAADGHGSVRA